MNWIIRMVQGLEQSGLKLVVDKIGFGLVRHLMTVAGGFFISRGVMDDNQVETAVAAVITLLGVAWSVLVKMSMQQRPENKTVVSGPVNPAAKDVLRQAGLIILVAVLPLIVGSGCATSANDVAMARIAADTAQSYYEQPNNATYMEFEGSNVSFSITGASRLVFSGPIPTKSIYPREEGALSKTISGVTDIAKVAGLTYVGAKLASAPRSVEPKVVTTEKLVPVTGAAQ